MLVKLMAEAVVPPASRNSESRIFVESGRRLASTLAKTAKAAQKSQGARWPKRRSAAPCCHSRSYLSRDEGLGLHMVGSEFPGKGAKHSHEGSDCIVHAIAKLREPEVGLIDEGGHRHIGHEAEVWKREHEKGQREGRNLEDSSELPHRLPFLARDIALGHGKRFLGGTCQDG